jgi:predicted dehydrogenase
MEQNRHLILIGAGQIGSRHLQAMSLSPHNWTVNIIDPNSESLELSRKRWNEVAQNASNIEVFFSNSLPNNASHIDVAIIATSAAHRLDALKTLLAYQTPSYLILEKVLFQSEVELDKALLLLQGKNVKTYVNCPRRIYPFYLALKDKLADQSDVNMTVSGHNWDMACNGIHHLDLWCFLTGKVSFDLDVADLLPKITMGKRHGTQEIFGTLHASTENTKLNMFCGDSSPLRHYTVNISSPAYEFEIDEPGRNIRTIRSRDGNADEQVLSIVFQSVLTHKIADTLIDTGQCGLTLLADSANIHRSFLRPLLEHFKSLDPTLQQCPIT